MQKNIKCRLCDDMDETFNHFISDCSKLRLKEYKSTHDWYLVMFYSTSTLVDYLMPNPLYTYM